MSKEVLGTGLSGLVGSRIVELNPQYRFPGLSLDTKVDILDFHQLESYFQNFPGDIVLHLAAFTDTTAAWQQRGDQAGLCYRLNVEGTQNILTLCQKYHKYLIYISTDFVFDGNKNSPYTEEDTPNPIDWYGQTKYLGEKLILDSGLPAAIVRIAYPYRSHFEPKPDIIRKIIAKFKAGETLKMFTDQITTSTFIDDIANGLRYFIDTKPTGIYHLVGSSSQSPYVMAQTVAEVFGFDKNLVVPSTLTDYLVAQPPNSRPWQPNLALSNQKITDLGVQMQTLRKGLEQIKKQS